MSIDDENPLSHDFEGPSRSQLRREALDVLDLAKRLMDLTEAELERIPMSDDLRDLVRESREVRQHIARKRQAQFLAKRLRAAEDEIPAMRAALAHDRAEELRETARLHRLEAQRDQLIAEGDEAMNEFLARAPHDQRQQLRQLIRRARFEREQGKPPAAARELFRVLREMDAPAD